MFHQSHGSLVQGLSILAELPDKQYPFGLLESPVLLVRSQLFRHKGVDDCDWTASLGLISIGLKPSELVSLRSGLDEKL